jgi:DNA-binding beta-propeller fold protein YncE
MRRTQPGTGEQGTSAPASQRVPNLRELYASANLTGPPPAVCGSGYHMEQKQSAHSSHLGENRSKSRSNCMADPLPMQLISNEGAHYPNSGPKIAGSRTAGQGYYMGVPGCVRLLAALAAGAVFSAAQHYAAPAGVRVPFRRGGQAVLPGGRVLAPHGEQFPVAGSISAFAFDPSAGTAATLGGAKLTFLEPAGYSAWRATIKGAGGLPEPGSLVWTGEWNLAFSHGSSVALYDARRLTRHEIALNEGGFERSEAGALACDPPRGWLFAADRRNARVVLFNLRTRKPVASIPLPSPPEALTWSSSDARLYVAGGGEVIAFSVSTAGEPHQEWSVRVGGGKVELLAAGGRLFLALAEEDKVTALDPASGRILWETTLLVPGLETQRGAAPSGMAFDAPSGRLVVAETGLNAVAVIDSGGHLSGHIPTGWAPFAVAIASGGRILVANSRGTGSGPSAWAGEALDKSAWRRGSISIFPFPAREELQELTAIVMDAAGLRIRPGPPSSLPSGVRYVLVIVNGQRSYDELLGDLPGLGAPALARFGSRGYVDGQHERLSVKDVNVTPNLHALAGRYSFADNFHAGSFSTRAGETAEFPGALIRPVAASGLTVRVFSETDAAGSLERAARFLAVLRPGYQPPRLMVLELGGNPGEPKPEAGFPYAASQVVANDAAIGRVMAALSAQPWWKELAVFITERGAGQGLDHLDADRTPLICAGPWARRGHVVHVNADSASLAKTVYRLLGLPPATLEDAGASDLAGCFSGNADPAPYTALPADERLLTEDARAR